MTHNDRDFTAMYREQRIDRERCVAHARRAGFRRRRTARTRTAIVIGAFLTTAGRALEQLGERLSDPDEASPRACA